MTLRVGHPSFAEAGTATQLIVDGRPFLLLAGELSNNGATSRDYMKPIWAKIVEARLNTVLAGVSWAQIEPQEGKFDFSVLDGVIQDARSHNLHLVLLWFASYKNGSSSYPPDWLKKRLRAVPARSNRGGKSIEMLSTFSDANRDAGCQRLCGFDAARQGSGWPAPHGSHDPGGERSWDAG